MDGHVQRIPLWPRDINRPFDFDHSKWFGRAVTLSFLIQSLISLLVCIFLPFYEIDFKYITYDFLFWFFY